MTELSDRIRSSRTDSYGTHPVSRLVFDLTDTNAFREAIEHCVHWLAPKTRVGIPSEAENGSSFDVSDQYGANPCRASFIEANDGRVWAARLDETDNFGRTWIAELYVEQQKGRPARFGTQLVCVNRGYEPFNLSRPSVVRDILSELSAEADGWQLNEHPQSVEDANLLVELLYAPDRRLPVIVCAPDYSISEGHAAVDMRRLAGRVAGAAHLVILEPDAAWELTRLVGKQMSCYQGAARLYMPGLNDETEDPYQHPLWLLRAQTNPFAIANSIAARVLPLGFLARSDAGKFPQFSEVRNASARQALANRADLSQAQRTLTELETTSVPRQHP
jgi:hypothetical protein